jgi:hypothetical protein
MIKKNLGKFKDKVNSKIINQFIELRAKMYALDIQNQGIRKVNGIAVKNSISFESYIEVLGIMRHYLLK